MEQQIPIGNFLTMLSTTLKKQFTDEQKEFMSDFTRPTISFSSPGTGKTASAIGGLLTTELYHKIPGKNIYALSFTNMATLELSNRYADECKKLGIRPHINFQTLHSLCSHILHENFMLLGMDRLKVVSQTDIEALASMLMESAKEMDIPITKYNVRNVIRAVRSLNSSLVFDQNHVESKYAFKMCGLEFEEFTKIRKMLYMQGKLTETVQVQDILLYTLELMLKHPEVSQEFKAKCKVLLVDEFQDLSLLQLRLISLMSDNVVAIGDIKQQIYAFNGACQEIVSQFYKYFPNAREINLNQSFRCKDEIAEYSKLLIAPNKMGEQDFKGIGPGGTAKILKEINLSEICDKIEEEYRANNNTFPESILFLFRNNYSAIPISEELFKRKVPFRVNKYTAANQIPEIRELCELCDFALNPTTLSNMKALQYLIPEFRYYRPYTQNPLYKIAAKEGKSPFEINFNFRDPGIGSKAMSTLIEVQEALRANKTAAEVFNILWPVYNTMYLQDREHFLEFPSSYYLNLVGDLVRSKTYLQFVRDEGRKQEVIKESETFRRGVRCYTFHAAKGLEADVVYIISADQGVVPGDKKLDDMEKKGCALEKARELRNERALVFVACTRAKSKLYISYDYKLSSLFSGVNTYDQYDELYSRFTPVYPDVEAFEAFFGGK